MIERLQSSPLLSIRRAVFTYPLAFLTSLSDLWLTHIIGISTAKEHLTQTLIHGTGFYLGLTLVALAYRPLLYVTVDATAARAARLDVRLYKRLMVVLTALVVVSAMQIMGVILVAAMLVVPVAAAALVARSFKQSILLAILAAEFAAIVGVTISYRYGLAAGGSIVLAAIGVYTTVLTAEKLTNGAAFLIRQRSPKQSVDQSTTKIKADGGDEE